MIMFKAITPEIHPLPNHSRHVWAGWDAYINTSDPDGLYAEFLSTNVPIHRELENNSDGLRAFESPITTDMSCVLAVLFNILDAQNRPPVLAESGRFQGTRNRDPSPAAINNSTATVPSAA